MWEGIFKKTSVTLIFFHHYIFYPLATQVHISLSKVYADILQLRVVLSINLSLNYAAYIFFFFLCNAPSLKCYIFVHCVSCPVCIEDSIIMKFYWQEAYECLLIFSYASGKERIGMCMGLWLISYQMRK